MKRKKVSNEPEGIPNTHLWVRRLVRGTRYELVMIESLESRIAPATFIVTTLADSDAGSLRQAIADANDSPGADIIVFKKGLTGAVELTTGEIEISDTLAIKGPGASKLIIDQQGPGRIFAVGDMDDESPLAISGLTFVGGDADNLGTGGAINSGESLKITNCVFKNNTSERSGGAISVFDGSQSERVNVEIKNSVFTGNFSGSFNGGAVNIEIDGNAVVKGCIFVGNSSDIRAGALSVGITTGGTARIEGCQFIGNEAKEHGALNVSLDDGAKAIVRGNVFTGNQATQTVAGAIAMFGGDIIFDRNIVSQNTSERQGGGIFTGQFTSLKISKSQFIDNESQLSGFFDAGGGAISIGGDQPDGSIAEIIGCLISGNSSTRGGGIYVEEDPFVLKIMGTKISGNHSGTEGGGIFVDGGNGDLGADIEVAKSTISGNVAANLGGGVFSTGDGAFTMKSSKVLQNVGAAGGGLFLGNTTKVVISGGLIAQNYSESNGGGIVSGVALELSGTKIIGNIAKQLGGGIFSSGDLDIADALITKNAAIAGGAIFKQSPGEPSLLRTKVVDNISNNGEQISSI